MLSNVIWKYCFYTTLTLAQVANNLQKCYSSTTRAIFVAKQPVLIIYPGCSAALALTCSCDRRLLDGWFCLSSLVMYRQMRLTESLKQLARYCTVSVLIHWTDALTKSTETHVVLNLSPLLQTCTRAPPLLFMVCERSCVHFIDECLHVCVFLIQCLCVM